MPVGHRTADRRVQRPDRLVARTRGRSAPRPLLGAVGLVLLQPGHFIMQTCQFRNLRARVSAQAPGPS
jgi:hypothetical protein